MAPEWVSISDNWWTILALALHWSKWHEFHSRTYNLQWHWIGTFCQSMVNFDWLAVAEWQWLEKELTTLLWGFWYGQPKVYYIVFQSRSPIPPPHPKLKHSERLHLIGWKEFQLIQWLIPASSVVRKKKNGFKTIHGYIPTNEAIHKPFNISPVLGIRCPPKGFKVNLYWSISSYGTLIIQEKQLQTSACLIQVSYKIANLCQIGAQFSQF